MKHIPKGPECPDLATWRQVNANTQQNLTYGAAGFPRKPVLVSLLREQGWLCAYTLKLIDETSAHIEHIKPQTLCRAEDEQRESQSLPKQRLDIAWKNIVACFPAPNQEAPPGYGADKKGSWWPAIGYAGFVSPLDPTCEEKFVFGVDGSIKHKCDAGKETIEKIGLDDGRLVELRKSAMLRAGLHPRSPKLLMSAAHTKKLIAAWAHRNAEGKFKEFCTPLKAVALKHLAKIEGRI